MTPRQRSAELRRHRDARQLTPLLLMEICATTAPAAPRDAVPTGALALNVLIATATAETAAAAVAAYAAVHKTWLDENLAAAADALLAAAAECTVPQCAEVLRIVLAHLAPRGHGLNAAVDRHGGCHPGALALARPPAVAAWAALTDAKLVLELHRHTMTWRTEPVAAGAPYDACIASNASLPRATVLRLEAARDMRRLRNEG